MSKMQVVGEVIHYYTKISVAIVDVTDTIRVGDKIRIVGTTTDLTQSVKSMQIEHKDVKKVGKGDSIGLKVAGRCRKGDNVYKIQE